MKTICQSCGTIYHTEQWLRTSTCPFCGAQQPVKVSHPVVEGSNPGAVGHDTGYTFRDTSGNLIRVLTRVGESDKDAIVRVRKNHRM